MENQPSMHEETEYVSILFEAVQLLLGESEPRRRALKYLDFNTASCMY